MSTQTVLLDNYYFTPNTVETLIFGRLTIRLYNGKPKITGLNGVRRVGVEVR